MPQSIGTGDLSSKYSKQLLNCSASTDARLNKDPKMPNIRNPAKISAIPTMVNLMSLTKIISKNGNLHFMRF